MDELLAQFLIEARELVPEASVALDALRHAPGDRAQIDAAFRAVHTLKGSVALFDMAPAGRTLHAAEDLLDAARGGRVALDIAGASALLACIDRVDAWVDAMEADGRLPPDAGADAARLLRRLGGDVEPDPAAAAPQAMPGWVRAMLDGDDNTLPAADGDLVAFRYSPDAECFFRGDDPLALVAGIPELVTLRIGSREDWPATDLIDPFRCNLLFDGLSAAPLAAAQAALRVVGEQAGFFVVPRRSEDAGGPAEVARTLRIDERRVDALVDHVGELVVAGNGLRAILADAGTRDAALAQRLRAFQGELDRGIAAMRRAITAVRLVPVGPAIRRLPRLVREIADALGRDVSFVIHGEATEIDKAIADMLFEPLLHIVRNALDHGIESPAHRLAAGKTAQGSLRLAFDRVGEHLHVRLSDDGGGIDPARILASAVSRGIVTADAAAALDTRGAINLIFAPGFSTADRVTDLSGRGVGMDAVSRSVEAVGGRIEVESAPGSGTTMTMILPFSAITTRLLIVRSGDDRYAFPFDRIVETASLPAERIARISGGEALVLRDKTISVLHLADLLGGTRTPAATARLLVTRAGGESVAIVVDAFGDQVDLLVRPATGLLASFQGISGTTVLGTGDVLIVLDPERLIG